MHNQTKIDPCSFLQQADIKIWVLTGDKVGQYYHQILYFDTRDVCGVSWCLPSSVVRKTRGFCSYAACYVTFLFRNCS